MAAQKQPKAATQNSPDALLVELFVEELPPKALKTIGESFAQLIASSLQTQGLVTASTIASYATPRRLAVHITDVAEKAADKTVQQKLMPVSIGLDANGQPTQALLKRLTALGVDASAVPNLKRAVDGKSEALFLDTTVQGASLVEGLQKALDEMLAKLPIPKVMTYQLEDGWSSVKFVRPAHGLIALHGAKIVPVSILGLTAGRVTQGHRFAAKTPQIKVTSADTYAQQIAKEGAVIASFKERREEIVRQLAAAATEAKLKPIDDDALLDEVTGLVEQPNVLLCQFEPEFLDVPQECLILTMKANQKYFPLFDANGKLSNRFLIVSNIHPQDPSRVVEGNERVVRPRLADAKFFYEQDRKKPLLSHLEALAKVVYHNKLGSQLDRVWRIEALAQSALTQLPPTGSTSKQAIAEAAQLCKCDLLTLMVGEFPELQGIMGRYYALAEGKSNEVAESIREHYLPRGSGDDLPATTTGMILALSDKIDTIAGVFAIDQKPTGAKDPFGVRRAAVGILRILIERKVDFDLREFILTAVKLQPLQNTPDPRAQEFKAAGTPSSRDSTTDLARDAIYDYIMDRLRSYYLEEDRGFKVTPEMFEAVLDRRPKSPLDFERRLRALHDFLQLGDAGSLAAANKRIGNILRKANHTTFTPVNVDLLRDAAEKELHEQVSTAVTLTEPLFEAREYAQALTQLARLRGAVDSFFDTVMVMADDEAVRNNRLALLAQLRRLFLRVADLSRLPG